MSTIRRVKGTLENVVWVNVWIAGCDDVGTIHYAKWDTLESCCACGVCELKLKRCKVVLREAHK
jgi:hypothetical protein